MSIDEKKRRLAEIETLIESCTCEEYADLAREYSILIEQIEADKNLHSEDIKSKERRENVMRIVSVSVPTTKRGVSQ